MAKRASRVLLVGDASRCFSRARELLLGGADVQVISWSEEGHEHVDARCGPHVLRGRGDDPRLQLQAGLLYAEKIEWADATELVPPMPSALRAICEGLADDVRVPWREW